MQCILEKEIERMSKTCRIIKLYKLNWESNTLKKSCQVLQYILDFHSQEKAVTKVCFGDIQEWSDECLRMEIRGEIPTSLDILRGCTFEIMKFDCLNSVDGNFSIKNLWTMHLMNTFLKRIRNTDFYLWLFNLWYNYQNPQNYI